MKAGMAALLALAMAPGAAEAATAGSIVSQYTDVDFSQCTVLDTDELGATYGCPGYKGIPLIIADEDERITVSYGLHAADEKAMQQGFGPFNDIGDKIEWRLTTNENGDMVPLAAILRWKLVDEAGKFSKQVLVVTQIKPGATCQIALIDAVAVKDANARAREIADKEAGSYECSKEPETVQPFTAY